ncbi:uncharacterized protein P174DRAFT_422925 [Aspergillus novofumigatus IBT 16806]|uniref:CCHC-type domain-containing protein n=1 Tax=Aspergillus novofumigatus (strain IBT 16806) TaxID=1392255 RepID=A0A2I1C2F6_ASPN1|nr:uncharacterized protein P174DRAFT_422925 [Aspergillus novofumigatus IBT 16806]PKX91773.1 hypothetical protein P174DRAFT_422925 [Aspergillus novofumigatus IBT 16806]
MSTVAKSGLAASMHAPQGASGSGGKRPRKGNGGRRPPRDKPVVEKRNKTEKRCRACGKKGHTMENCRLYGVVFTNLSMAMTREIATQSGRRRRHPLGPSQQHPRINSRQRRTARRLAERERQQQQQQVQALQVQEQLGHQQQSPQEQHPQHLRPAPQEPPEGASWAEQMDFEAEKNAQ